jgi:sarcosine oxidase
MNKPDKASLYDVIVLGTGGVGSAAACHLARRGLRVLGLDRFAAGHERGSSHGQTRVIRQAYFEHPDYVPLLLRAYVLWQELSMLAGQQLLHEAGLLQVGPAAGQVLAGVRRAAHEHGLSIENLSARQAMQRFPAFQIPDHWEAAFERRAGYLAVEDCVRAHRQAAQQAGAVLLDQVSVRAWGASGSSMVEVDSDAGCFRATGLVVTAGAWAGELLAGLGLRLSVLRKPLYWYPAEDAALRVEQGCPTWLFDTPEGVFYGFPQLDALGVKAARHSGGDPVTDPLLLDRRLDTREQASVEAFLSRHLPGVGRPHLQHSTCMYTMSADSDFIVDLHPQYPQVAFAAGLSGHGFKFTSVLGEALADLVQQGHSNLPIGFLNCRRAGLLG